jgi:hypothetical protein
MAGWSPAGPRVEGALDQATQVRRSECRSPRMSTGSVKPTLPCAPTVVNISLGEVNVAAPSRGLEPSTRSLPFRSEAGNEAGRGSDAALPALNCVAEALVTLAPCDARVMLVAVGCRKDAIERATRAAEAR